MTDRGTDRLIAWSGELRRAHARLREALELLRSSPESGAERVLADDLLIYCVGFCAALDAHHRGEDRTLFPAIEAAHPALSGVLTALKQDHSMLAHLIGGLQAAARAGASRPLLDQHLDGIEALMENHFRYEERELLQVLETLRLAARTSEALGPL